MMIHKLLAALTLVGVAAAFTGLGTFATPIVGAAQTANAPAVVYYKVSSLRYETDPALPLDIEKLTFDVSPAIVGAQGDVIGVQIDLVSGAPIAYQCLKNGSGSAVTCDTTSTGLTVDRFKGVTVAAE